MLVMWNSLGRVWTYDELYNKAGGRIKAVNDGG